MHFVPPPYLDPGSGSIIIQVIIAAILGIGVAMRGSWAKIRGWFGYKSDLSDDDSTDDK